MTRARVGEGTVRYSTCFHLSHVESAVASEADTHGRRDCGTSASSVRSAESVH